MLDGLLSGVFVGKAEHALDSKHRVTIPSDWRASVGESNRLFILPGINEKCLYVYTAQEMAHRIEKLKELSVADEKSRQLIRQIASRADSVVWDAQGRIRIKEHLLEHAGIEGHAVLSGAFNRFEIWNPEEFERAQAAGGDGASLEEAARYVGF